MSSVIRVALTLMALLASLPCRAHEFWLWPDRFSVALGGSVRLALRVGEYFEGDAVAFSSDHAAAMRAYANGTDRDLLAGGALRSPRADLRVGLGTPGTHLVAFDSQPTLIVLAADKFHAYLHDEGLDAIVRQREAAGTAAQPGRESYRRCVKTLLRAGIATNATDSTHAQRTGQRLELLPLMDPLRAGVGRALDFSLLFDGTPVAGRLVKAWHRRDGQTVMIRAHADAAGRVRFNLPYAGVWMISTVHMIPAARGAGATGQADWESFWASLTFELAG